VGATHAMVGILAVLRSSTWPCCPAAAMVCCSPVLSDNRTPASSDICIAFCQHSRLPHLFVLMAAPSASRHSRPPHPFAPMAARRSDQRGRRSASLGKVASGASEVLCTCAASERGSHAQCCCAGRRLSGRARGVCLRVQSPPPAVCPLCSHFINHRYPGRRCGTSVLCRTRTTRFGRQLCVLPVPSTFNLLGQVVDKPVAPVGDGRVMRITRHPQLTGQLVCALRTPRDREQLLMVWTSLAVRAPPLCSWHRRTSGCAQVRGLTIAEAHELSCPLPPFPTAAEAAGRLLGRRRPPYLAVVVFTVGTHYPAPVAADGLQAELVAAARQRDVRKTPALYVGICCCIAPFACCRCEHATVRT
jgi:hypothetical protein